MTNDTWSIAKNLFKTVTRKKTFDDEVPKKSQLKRTLNLIDLTALGVGSTLGCGVYALAGTVAKSIAGPAVVLSFALAAIASTFSGVCYAEFTCRLPKAGSAYVYSYVAIGELIAFIIGWNLLLKNIIGTSAVAKTMSNYLDSLLGDPQKKYMKKYFTIHMDYMNEYPDVTSFLFILFITLFVAWGVRKSCNLNNLFTALSMLTICTVIVSGFYFVNLSNWFIPKNEIPAGVDGGKGGFFPFGWTGIVAGAARCFYGFISFDSIVSAGEETKNPEKTMPLAIVLTFSFITFAYFGLASVLTLMWPYYDQDPSAPLLVIYDRLGTPVLKYLVTGGVMFALFTTLIGRLFPIPRILYAMSSDGLLFDFLAKINKKTKTPFIATIVCGVTVGLLSIVFDLEQLIDMASIGTLQSYMTICVCVLILRYTDANNLCSRDVTVDSDGKYNFSTWLNLLNAKTPNVDTQYISRVLILVFSVSANLFCTSVAHWKYFQGALQYALSIVICISVVSLLLTMLMLTRLPQTIENLPFKVPLVPFVPCVSIVLNLYLMVELSFRTWLRFSVCQVIGLLVYAFYGIRHSLEGIKQQAKRDEENRNEPIL
ncbi:Cationic amino acid transporter, C-terminal,Amino acid/polyamine transporter I [Cinara cedri]|uniref:Cationic amino acid transporter, C-terminal,Amino acid/polyamine transporter I n=1 Tax=Cinara cedri TaxID=506608 RepID=A0A5E4MSK5_9HEMI|nr:Cationic amino acid transporter, C-terminal,Amino acid/polyamine transporter I [Cinara cedri]